LVDAKISALLLFAACSVMMFLLGYCVSAFYYKDLKSSAMKKEESNAVEATIQEQSTTRESEANQETPPAVVNIPSPTKSPTQSSLASDVEQSENGSDASDPAVTVPVITLAPRPLKHPDVEHEPLLAPE
jgi:cell division protein FtsX